MKPSRFIGFLAVAIPFGSALIVWLSALAFVPVPWPDDSAFYFVARDLFRWPPRWVMLTQAPFEPTYAIWNFNTMPLYPILIGLGRWIGIDGSFGLKFWPLVAWAAAGALAARSLWKAKAPWPVVLLIALLFAADPILRWSSVLIRPESLIGLLGVALVCGLTLGFPRRFEPGRFWDPVAALFAIGAYAHFNAIHLVFPATIGILATDPRPFKRMVQITGKTLLYLSPWIFTVLLKPSLFIHQMTLQWTRLAIPNPWLSSFRSAAGALFQSMGSPAPWHPALIYTGITFGLLTVASVVSLGLFATKRKGNTLVVSAAWFLSAIWLWHTKPEVWFVHYMHVAGWTLAGFLLLEAHRSSARLKGINWVYSTGLLIALATVVVFEWTDYHQLQALTQRGSYSWSRSTYADFVDCISTRLKTYEAKLGNPRPFRVWAPTFPDITIELSLRHPDWEFTRTNDFASRDALAIEHAKRVEAVVIPETINLEQRVISAPWSEHPEIRSVWLDWPGYYLHRLATLEGWKSERYLCQRGRWAGFILMNP